MVPEDPKPFFQFWKRGWNPKKITIDFPLFPVKRNLLELNKVFFLTYWNCDLSFIIIHK